ncbi:AAA family ATPase [Paenibacillus arenilitoris]|uniref:AAA family ATPase n=1 Tax=Paenibacillus arenilitoris TaxID=2772299 RepID=A0A927CL92_9BACL|nr:AAA family ATPase [Paenibacillus arenilitoris]MBD2869262.1 AAA family ATPase [Paenibacillus arenilitoris]
MLNDKPSLYLITGIMASGKSTVAQLLAERFEKSVHLRGDVFRRMIVNDRQEVRPDSEDAELGQLRLRYRLAAMSADAYYEAGFTVVMQDVVIGPLLEEFLAFLRSRPVTLVVLCPSVEAVEIREAARSKKGYGIWTVSGLDQVLREETPRIGMWLDTTDLSPEETVAEILARSQSEGRIG